MDVLVLFVESSGTDSYAYYAKGCFLFRLDCWRQLFAATAIAAAILSENLRLSDFFEFFFGSKLYLADNIASCIAFTFVFACFTGWNHGKYVCITGTYQSTTLLQTITNSIYLIIVKTLKSNAPIEFWPNKVSLHLAWTKCQFYFGG